MIDVLIAAALLAFLVWLGRGASASKKAWSSGKWRIVGGMIALAVVVGATLLLVRGAWIGGVPLLITGLGMALAARRRGARATATATSPSSARMSAAEARSMLGVEEGASRAEIEAAYKRLIIRVHPDHGGASGLAIQLNAARDVLLKS
jgi:hypothetical protein